MLPSLKIAFHIVSGQLSSKVNCYRIKRIVGGRDTDIEVSPCVVSIQRKGRHACGGSIISEDWVITAAHCFSQISKFSKFPKLSNFKVRVGNTKSYEGGELIPIEEVIIHEDHRYKDFTKQPVSDIALVHLQKSIIFGKTQQPIPLIEIDKLPPPTGASAFISGWGDLGKRRKHTDVLQSAFVPIVSKEECSKMYASTFDIDDDQICAGYLGTEARDSCNGDSGGPLIVDKRLVGIVSFGQDCGSQKYPGVYTDVSHYRTWIKDKCGV